MWLQAFACFGRAFSLRINMILLKEKPPISFAQPHDNIEPLSHEDYYCRSRSRGYPFGKTPLARKPRHHTHGRIAREIRRYFFKLRHFGFTPCAFVYLSAQSSRSRKGRPFYWRNTRRGTQYDSLYACLKARSKKNSGTCWQLWIHLATTPRFL